MWMGERSVPTSLALLSHDRAWGTSRVLPRGNDAAGVMDTSEQPGSMPLADKITLILGMATAF